MSIFQFATLDPRKGGDQRAPEQWTNTLGVEVTVPALASKCVLGNIDPQHGHGTIKPTLSPPIGYVREDVLSAIDVAWGCALPPDGATLVTIRPDVDSIGAMAVLLLRRLGLIDGLTPDPQSAGAWRRTCDVSASDGFRPGGTWAPRPLPTMAAPWPTTVAPVGETESLAPLGVVCSPARGQREWTLADRVAVAACWLLWGKPNGARGCDSGVEYGWQGVTEQDRLVDLVYAACGAALPSSRYESSPAAVPANALVEAEVAAHAGRLAMAKAVESGEIKIRVSPGTCTCTAPCGPAYPWERLDFSIEHAQDCYAVAHAVAVVESAHIGAMGLGYCVAQVVVAVMPPVKGHHKATVGSWAPGLLDHVRVRAELNAAERAARAKMSTDRPDILKALDDGDVWGGAATITGSPQGLGTWLSVEEIARIAAEVEADTLEALS